MIANEAKGRAPAQPLRLRAGTAVRFPMVRTALLVLVAVLHLRMATAQEECYTLAYGQSYGASLLRIDPLSGSEAYRLALSGPSSQTPVGWALAHDGERLLSVGQLLNSGQMRLFSIHPADGTCEEVGNRGFSSAYLTVAFERSPVSGALYAVYRPSGGVDNLYTVDATGGQSTLVAPITGTASNDPIAALCIDAAGVAHAIGGYVYALDLATGAAVSLGQLFPVVGNTHFARDLAYDASGQLWALYQTWYFTPNTTIVYEIYQIDLVTVTATLMSSLPSTPWDSIYGLAFGPGTSWTTYCTAKMNSLACVPGITAEGYASPTASSGFTIGAEFLRNEVNGTLIFGVSGRIAAPFGGGTLCVAAPWRRTEVLSSGGPPLPSETCSGAWAIDFNEWMATHVALPAGLTIQAQWIGRDPGFAAPNNWSLTDALEFTLRP
jgi:hypothetical protein